jgi:hypothetical protein
MSFCRLTGSLHISRDLRPHQMQLEVVHTLSNTQAGVLSGLRLLRSFAVQSHSPGGNF